jgi:phosphohistidine swiveling domain-containing protein
MLSLNAITADDAPRVGGKAFNCARLKQAGVAVPDGVVLTTDAMGSPDLPELHEWLSALSPNTRLAVRSSGVDEDSAGHSFAGIHETKLNVRPSEVPEAIRSCWASVTSPQALAYRRAQNLPAENARTAVLIQMMVDAVTSGVAFTIDPITGSNDELIINSTFGLGEALVSGQVEPDEYRVRKADSQILDAHVAGDKPSLTDDLVRDLTNVLLRIERHYGAAQDVEWCYDGSRFWIVQSRPITTESSARRRDVEWTRANLREIFPDLPKPITLFAVVKVLVEGHRRFYGNLLAPAEELGPGVEIFYGRPYFNVDQMRHACRVTGIAPASALRSLGHEGQIPAEDEVAQPVPVKKFLRALPDIARITFHHVTIERKVRDLLKRIDESIRRLFSMDFRQVPDKDLWVQNKSWRPQLSDELQIIFTLGGVAGMEKSLHAICERAGMPYDRLLQTHLAAGEKSVSSQQAFDLVRLVQVARQNGGNTTSEAFQRQFKIFLEKYGHRGRYESDVSIPRYIEDPSPLLFAIRAHLEEGGGPDPDEIIQRQEADAEKTWMEFQSKLTAWQRATLGRRARSLLRRIKHYYVWRELVRSELIRKTYPMRLIHLEMARRFIERGWIESRDDYFYLTLTEIDAVVDNNEPGASLGSILKRRKAEWSRLAKIEMPLLMKESQLAAIVRRSASQTMQTETVSQLRGLPVSPGFAEGEVIVMRDASEFSQMKRGAILVTTATDPSWTPLFTLASGVIVEVGGLLSHASTVAREYGLPAVANVRHATRILKNGDRVRLDATAGVIEILSQKYT